MNEKGPDTASQTIIDRLLGRLSGCDLKDRIQVFGSVARGSENPGDLDIWVDMKDKELNFMPDRQVGFFLALARAFPGYLDPFVEYKNTIIVRNAECNDWVRAKFAKKIRGQVDKEGISLDAALLQRGLTATPARKSPSP